MGACVVKKETSGTGKGASDVLLWQQNDSRCNFGPIQRCMLEFCMGSQLR